MAAVQRNMSVSDGASCMRPMSSFRRSAISFWMRFLDIALESIVGAIVQSYDADDG